MRSGFRRGWWAAVVVMTAGFVFASSASAASGDCDATVGDVATLNAAIACYNAETVAGAHTITLGSDIVATGPSLDIAGPAGATLLIDGDSHTYDANSLARGFTVLNSGDVTFNDITITGGDSTLILKGGGGILNLGRTRVQNSTIVGNEGTFGGGILNEFGVGALPVLNVFNSTITDNTASGASGFGAGIYNNFNAGNFRAYAFGTAPTGGVVNFAPLTPAMNNSNTIVVPIDSNGNLVLDVNSPSAIGPVVDVRGVILGYYD